MTKFMPLFVPYAERRIARSLGAEWCPRARRWVCTTTRYKSAIFKRWRDTSRLQRVRIYPDSTPQGIAAAKAHDCAWDAAKKEWFVDITSTDTLSPWHLERLAPPPDHVLHVSYDEREFAKQRGARWNAKLKAWVLSTREPLDRWATKRCAAVQSSEPHDQQSAGGAHGARAVE
jgi:hypothetical protein